MKLLSPNSIISLAQNLHARSLLVVARKNYAVAATVNAEDVQRDESWSEARPYKDIPGPSLWDLAKMFRPGGKFDGADFADIQQEFKNRYGNISRLPGVMGKDDVLFIYDPEDMKKIYRTEGAYPIRRGLDSNEYYRKVYRKDLFQKTGGLVTEQGKDWWDFRHKVNAVMMSPKATKVYVPKIDEISSDFLDKIYALRSADNKVPKNFLDLVNSWALESVCYISMDTRIGLLGEHDNVIAKQFMINLKRFFDLTYRLDILPSIWKFYKTPLFNAHMKNLDEIVNGALHFLEQGKAQLKEKQRNNTITENETGVLEKLLKIDEDVAMVMTLDSIVAGVDTTSSTTFGVLYSLALNQDKQEILRNELRVALPEKDTKLTPENMRNMPYLRACIKEALRMHPLAAGNFRATGRDITLQGYQIPQNTNVAMAQQILCNKDEHFGESHKFIPERFLREGPGAATGCPKAKDANPFIYLPFGFGPRMCVGRRFAELEIESLVARTIRRYQLEWNGPPPTIQSTFVRIPIGDTHFILNDIAN